MTTYNYTIDPFNADRLTQEIQQSMITIMLDHISALGTSVDINFKADLPTEDKTTLDAIVAAHTGAPLIVDTPQNVTITNVPDVRTQFEQVSYLLQMSNVSSLNIAPDASATLTIKIPGTFSGVNPPCDGRYIDAGEGWFYPGADGDRVTAITITDNDNLLGAGAGYVLGTYHDAQVDEANQGWALHPVFPTEISTLGWYGFIPAGMYMNITVKRSPTASANGNFYCNLKWGMRT